MLNPVNPRPESSDNPNPHDKKTNGLIKSLIRYFYYNLDFIFGYNFVVRKRIVQKQLVIFDRYYYDYFVDLRRYQYSFPNWVPKFFAWSIPKPNIVFVLEGDAKNLYQRKQELSIKEIERQLMEYHKIALKYHNAIIVDVDKPLEEVTSFITREILLRKAKRTAVSMRNSLDKYGIPL